MYVCVFVMLSWGVAKSLYGVNVCMCVCNPFLGVGKSLYGVNVCMCVCNAFLYVSRCMVYNRMC